MVRMKRVARMFPRIVMCLLAGAFINVGVAWWLGWRVLYQPESLQLANEPMEAGEFTPQANPSELIGPAGLSLSRTRQFGADHVLWQRVPWTLRWADRPVIPLDTLWPHWGPLAGRDPREVYESMNIPIGHTARGWPMLSMWCAFEQGTHGRVQGGIHLGHKQTPNTFFVTELVLPLRPIWTGIAVNTLSYASLTWIIITLPLAWRRRRRVRRGLCAECAYPLGSSPVCTECGERVDLGSAHSSAAR